LNLGNGAEPGLQPNFGAHFGDGSRKEDWGTSGAAILALVLSRTKREHIFIEKVRHQSGIGLCFGVDERQTRLWRG
jgi:hypothetical protein